MGRSPPIEGCRFFCLTYASYQEVGKMTGSKEIEKALFEAAVIIDAPDVREVFLDQACEDAAQRTRLGRLLAAHQAADDWMEEAEHARTVVAAEAYENLTELPAGAASAACDYFPESDGPGTWIGRYKVQERIGEGGCGVDSAAGAGVGFRSDVGTCADADPAQSGTFTSVGWV